jgi:hypothetical protein
MYTVNLKKLQKGGRHVIPVAPGMTQHQRVLANREARRKKLEKERAKKQLTNDQPFSERKTTV